MTTPRFTTGGPAERTTLAWTRTSFAFLVNGALLAVKDVHGTEVGSGALVPAALACVVALLTYTIALRRQKTLAEIPLPTNINPRRQVHIIGIAALLLIVTTSITELL